MVGTSARCRHEDAAQALPRAAWIAPPAIERIRPDVIIIGRLRITYDCTCGEPRLFMERPVTWAANPGPCVPECRRQATAELWEPQIEASSFPSGVGLSLFAGATYICSRHGYLVVTDATAWIPRQAFGPAPDAFR